MKKIISLTLVLILSFGCLSMVSFAEAETYFGECGDHLTWSLNTKTGVLSIDGEGDMYDYELYNNINKSSAPWWDYYSYIKTLDIGENVSSIGDYALYRCSTLTELDIPVNIKTIGDYAFYECTGLKKLTFAEGVETIGEYTFAYTGKGEVVLPDSLKSLGNYAFRESGINSVIIGDGLSEISKGAFYNARFSNFEFGLNVERICQDAFRGIHCIQIILPRNLKVIDQYVFFDSTVQSISIPLSINKIGSSVFENGTVANIVYLKNVYYEGTIEQWEEIDISSYNDCLKSATFHFGHSHNYTSEITTAPTCLEKGLKTYTCSCGNSYTRELAAFGHDVIIDEAIEATCLENGLTEGERCSRCDYKIEQTVISALGHDMINLEASEPTCTETGLTSGVACSRCDEVFDGRQETVQALGHDEVIDEAVASTCTETGLTEGKHCNRCGETLIAQEIVAAEGHKEVFTNYVEPTCTKDGLSVGKVCSVCGEVFIPAQVIPAKGHSYSEWIVTANATCTTDGKKIKLCSCGLSEEETIKSTCHADKNADGICDNCSAALVANEPEKEDTGFIAQLRKFFETILNFLKGLFKIVK